MLGIVWKPSPTILISAITPPESSVNTQRAVSQDIYQRICPTVVQVGTNITLEDCEDTLHQVVGKAQQLFTCSVSKYAGNRIQDSDSHSDTQCRTRRRFVISVTKWMRTRLSSLVISVTGSRTFLSSLRTRAVQGPLVDNSLC